MLKNLLKPINISISMGTVVSVTYSVMESQWGRSQRLQFKAARPVKNRAGEFPFIMKSTLEDDLRKVFSNPDGGVKIFWAPPGAGKTTTALRVCNECFKEKIIGGICVFRPPKNETKFADWLSSQSSDFIGPLWKPEEALSDLLPSLDKPIVIIIDQIDNCPLDKDTERVIRCLAEDSTLCKSYIVNQSIFGVKERFLKTNHMSGKHFRFVLPFHETLFNLYHF